jgi:hypothetical protein
VISDVRGLHQAFEEAELRADTGTLQALLADDFRSIGDQGYVLDKAQWIKAWVEQSEGWLLAGVQFSTLGDG